MHLADLAVLVLETIANNMVVLAEHEIVPLMTAVLTAVLEVTQNGNHEVRVAVVLLPGVTSETCYLVLIAPENASIDYVMLDDRYS